MKYTKYAHSMLFSLFVAIGGVAEESEATSEGKLGWGVYSEQPAAFITQGDKQGLGIVDQIYSELHLQLPDYQHHFVEAKLLRIITKVSAGENICTVMFKTADRESKVLFSARPIGWITSFRLVIATDKLEDFRSRTGWQSGSISLSSLIKNNKSLRLGLVTGTSYGSALDMQLQAIDKNNNVYRHSGFDSARAILRMLLAGRVDYILEQSWTIKYMLKDEEERVTFIPIANMPFHNELFIGCPKTLWGQAVIDRINPIVDQVRDSARSGIEYWLPKSELPDYRRSYQEQFN